MTFGKRLMQLRKEHGYRNRDAFAAELGIPANTLRNYEMDIREPGFPFLIKMSQLFHVSTDYLLGLTEERATTAVDVQSISEQQLIEKYRLLDCTGKDIPRSMVSSMEKAKSVSDRLNDFRSIFYY